MRKEEIACHKQFLLFSQPFPQLYIFSASKCCSVWQWVKSPEVVFEQNVGEGENGSNKLNIAKIMISFNTCENIVGKGENAGSPFATMFLTLSQTSPGFNVYVVQVS